MTSAVVLDDGWATTRQAEHALYEWAARLGLTPVLACTRFVTEPNRVVVLAEFAEPFPRASPPSGPSVRWMGNAITASADAEGARVFVFPGGTDSPSAMSVAELVAASAIDRVELIGGLPVAPETRIDTQGFVRPSLRGGRLILLTQPAAGGILVPFEQPNPTPCCANHA